jgi:hypothetical protein
MKGFRCLLGITLISCAIAIQPARAELKPAQCQRFEENLARFNTRLTARENDRPTKRALVETLAGIIDTEIQDLQIQKFSDTKLQSMHQQSIDILIAARGHMTGYLTLVDQGEQAKAETEVNKVQAMPYQQNEVFKQFDQYCNRS